MTRLRELPLLRLSEIQPGLVRVRARLGSARPIAAPISGRPSVYYFVAAERLGPVPRKKRRLGSHKEWTEVDLEDGELRVAVQPWTPTVASAHVDEERFEGLVTIPPDRVDLFELVGIADRHLGRIGPFHVLEYRLEPGDEVYVTGTYAPEKGIYRDGRSPLIVSAQPEIGYLRSLKNELVLYTALPPMVLAAGLLLFVLAWL